MFRGSLACVALLAVAVVGCGPSGPVTVAVSGKVAVDGQPVDRGMITFTPADRKSAAQEALIKDGAYTAEVTVGPKTVAIRAQKVVGKKPAYANDPSGPMLEELSDLKLEDRAANLSYEVPAAGGSFDATDLKTVK